MKSLKGALLALKCHLKKANHTSGATLTVYNILISTFLLYNDFMCAGLSF